MRVFLERDSIRVYKHPKVKTISANNGSILSVSSRRSSLKPREDITSPLLLAAYLFHYKPHKRLVLWLERVPLSPSRTGDDEQLCEPTCSLGRPLRNLHSNCTSPATATAGTAFPHLWRITSEAYKRAKVFSFQTERASDVCATVRSEHGAGSPFQDASCLLEPWSLCTSGKLKGACARVHTGAR